MFIPTLLLKKLYTLGSLANVEQGVRFAIKNRLSNAEVTDLVSVTIDPSAVDPADVEMLQDLIVAAVNDAFRAAKELGEAKMAAVTGGMRLPGM
jgi:hypothetical protein